MSLDTPLRLLLVEDDPVMQLGLETFFEHDPKFTIAGQETDGYLAIRSAHALHPDLIIMDVGLPQLNGIAATREIKAALPHIKVVMLTSHDHETEIVAALSSGADAYCIKGTSLSSLLTAIAAAQEGAIYLDPQIARTLVNCFRPSPSTPQNLRLSAREMEVLTLIVDGYSNPEIAEKLYLSLSTVKGHVRNVMSKLSVDDRVQAAVVALRAGLLQW
jgi:DNA-binding NarL/FixJ family response regulator